jgi:hypothetical protein
VTIALVLISLVTLAADESSSNQFSDVRIEKPFDRYLLANPLLMETSGTKVIKLSNKRSMIVAVASTPMNDNSARDRLRAEKVCRVKAFAALVQEQKGVHVFNTEKSTDTTVVVTEDQKEHSKSISTLLEVTTTKVQGIAKDMPVIGRWKSKDGEIFYLAIGAICDKRGNPIVEDSNGGAGN